MTGVSWSKTVKYLNTILDSGLRWPDSDRVRWALGTFNTLYPFINRKNALLIRYKILLYYTIRCVFTLLYAAPVWTMAPRTYLNRLQIIQNKFLRKIFNAQIDTRIADLHQETELESVDQVIAQR